MDSSREVDILNYLLNAMQALNKEADLLDKVGIQIQSLMDALDAVWDCIKKILGMPETEEPDIWVSDHWFNMVGYHFSGLISREEVVQKLLNWQNDLS